MSDLNNTEAPMIIAFPVLKPLNTLAVAIELHPPSFTFILSQFNARNQTEDAKDSLQDEIIEELIIGTTNVIPSL